jgi:hypothetical protein
MKRRKHILTTCRIDLALILLPLTGLQEAARMLANSGIPIALAACVLSQSARRRTS